MKAEPKKNIDPAKIQLWVAHPKRIEPITKKVELSIDWFINFHSSQEID